VNRARSFGIVIALILLAMFFSISACSSTSTGPTTITVNQVKPSVQSVSIVNTGTSGNYYAILDITVRNAGADGMVIVVGHVTQGGQTTTSQMPAYLTANSKQVIRMVMPLQWGAGQATAAAEVQIP